MIRQATDTRRAAAAAIAPKTATLRARVLEYVKSCGLFGATDEEAENALGLRSQSYTPRRGELVAAGLVADSGRRRMTSSRRLAVIWIAPEVQK